MATTPNYGWVTPAPTDFVTDLPADFEVFADAVDADLAGLLGGTTGQYLAKDTDADHDFSWVTPAANPITTEGDLIIGDATGDPVRLPIGAAGTYLQSDGDTASWATVSAGGWTLINTGGTTLSGSSTVTITGLTGYDDLLIVVTGCSGVNTSMPIQMGFNSFTQGCIARGSRVAPPSTYNATLFESTVNGVIGTSSTDIDVARTGTAASGEAAGFMIVHSANQAGIKPLFFTFGVNPDGGNSHRAMSGGGFYTDANVISSVAIRSGSGNFDNGTIHVYGR